MKNQSASSGSATLAPLLSSRCQNTLWVGLSSRLVLVLHAHMQHVVRPQICVHVGHCQAYVPTLVHGGHCQSYVFTLVLPLLAILPYLPYLPYSPNPGPISLRANGCLTRLTATAPQHHTHNLAPARYPCYTYQVVKSGGSS